MNRERAKELLPIIEAFANGEEIQRQFQETIDPDTFKWGTADFIDDVGIFRIKPKPREWYVYDGNDEPIITKYIDDLDPSLRSKWVKVREVP